jgi:hypothetical protein
MSHTTTINTITITDVNAFRAAVSELRTRGVLKGELKENTVPRAYFTQQSGMTEPADLTLDLSADGSPYDVGFYRKEGGGYEARADFYNNHIQKVLGAAPAEGDNPDQAKLGKLYQEYVNQVATREFIREGHNVERVDQADGSVQLVVTVAA